MPAWRGKNSVILRPSHKGAEVHRGGRTGACLCLLCARSVVSDSLRPQGLWGSSVHGILQARILEWVAISFSRGSSRPRDRIRVSCVGRWILYHCATRETGPRDTKAKMHRDKQVLLQCLNSNRLDRSQMSIKGDWLNK